MTPRAARWTLTSLAALVAASGCGGDDTSSSGASVSSSSSGSGTSGAGGGGGAAGGGVTTSASTGPGGSGGGGGGACAPGESAECYSGPIGTQGVGSCAAGSRTCLPDGTGFGPCEGEVLPADETCLTPADDDCDGDVNEEGAGCACTPGSVDLCYSGPVATEGVGTCTAGVITCNAEGTGYGPCEGEITPVAEDCTAPADEDCDGSAPLCPALWASRFGGAAEQFGWGLAVDAAGNVFVAGDTEGAGDFGGGTLTSAGLSDAFVVKLDPAGAHAWSKIFGNASTQSIQAVAADPAGGVVLAGYFQGTINFGGLALTSAGGADIFIAKLDAAGNHVWSRRVGSATDDQLGLAVAVDPLGDVAVAGSFTGTITFGGGNLVSAGGADVFVAKLSGATGAHVWSQRYGDAGITQAAYAIAFDPTGAVLVAGEVDGSVDFGGGALPSLGGSDAFVVKRDPAGAHVFSRRWGGPGLQAARAVAADAGGNALVAGDFAGALDAGGGALANAGQSDVFLARLDPAGMYLAAASFGGPGYDSARGLATAPGRIGLTGYFEGMATFAGEPLASAGGRDVFLLELADMSFAAITARAFGDAAFYQAGAAIAYDAGANVHVGGYFAGSVDFGLGPLTSAGNADVFVAKFAP